jgi:glyoxylate/hydroxypyruvate reductase A
MTLLVAITAWEVQPWIDRFQALLPDRKVVALGEPFDRREVHYVAAWKHPPGSLAGLPNLAAIFSLGAGVDHLINDERLPDAPIIRIIDTDLTKRMSEYVVMHCLMQLRQHRLYDQQQRESVWFDDRFQPAAGDVRVGVMGMGVLGQDAAHKLQVMGFDVAGWSRSSKDIPGLATFAGEAELPAFLARTDILVSLLPLTGETRGILNASLFARLARDGRIGGPVLINAGRGGSQVESDIVAALDSGLLSAAVLDVFETEPLPVESPLWTHPHVTVTPHNASMSAPETVAAFVVAQIRALEEDRVPEGLVDRATGY